MGIHRLCRCADLAPARQCYCEGADYDAIILDDLIDRERNDELKKEIEDLRDFIFPP